MSLHALAAAVLLSSATPRPQAAQAALRGLDPVELVAGREVQGSDAFTLEHEGYRYAFSGEAQRESFRASPDSFAIQLGGCCGSMGPLAGAGDPARFLVHEGRIYIFASDACRASFQKEPERYIDVPDPMPRLSREQLERGKALLEQVLSGVGGAAALDGLKGLRLGWQAKRGTAPKTYAWREELHYDFATGLRELRTVHDQDEWFDSLQGSTGTFGEAGGERLPMNAARRKEFARQTGRELPWLLRARGSAEFMTWAPRRDEEEELGALEPLVVRLGEANTTLYVDPTSGRVLRSRWLGRLGTGAIGEIEVEFANFEVLGGVALPTVRTVTFDGERVEHLSGRLGLLTLD